MNYQILLDYIDSRQCVFIGSVDDATTVAELTALRHLIWSLQKQEEVIQQVQKQIMPQTAIQVK